MKYHYPVTTFNGFHVPGLSLSQHTLIQLHDLVNFLTQTSSQYRHTSFIRQMTTSPSRTLSQSPSPALPGQAASRPLPLRAPGAQLGQSPAQAQEVAQVRVVAEEGGITLQHVWHDAHHLRDR